MKSYFKNLWNVFGMLFWLWVLVLSNTIVGIWCAIFGKSDNLWIKITDNYINIGESFKQIKDEYSTKDKEETENLRKKLSISEYLEEVNNTNPEQEYLDTLKTLDIFEEQHIDKENE